MGQRDSYLKTESESVWGHSDFSELGGDYVWFPFYPGIYDTANDEDEAHFSDNLDLLKELAKKTGSGAIFTFCEEPENPNSIQDDPIFRV